MTDAGKPRAGKLLTAAVCLAAVLAVSAFLYGEYRRAAFEHISGFCAIAASGDPQAEKHMLSAVKKYAALDAAEKRNPDFLARYGYVGGEFAAGADWRFFAYPCALFMAISGCYAVWAICADKRNRLRIAELTAYLEEVNVGKGAAVIQRSEDEFSHLQDEMYKTVTELYRTRELAVSAKANFADNLANIAHQLKTPITAAVLSLQLMREECPNVYVRQIQKQLERLDRLEGDLITLSRIDAGALPLDVADVDVYTALTLAADNLADLLRKKNVTVRIPDKGCVEIRGDLEWTMEALMNLMKNCMEHSPRGGSVYCDYSYNPLYVEIRVWDEGRGFAPADLPRLFERFYRGKNAADGGTGIGLALAKSVFELQNGSIAAYNLPTGGACFEIRIYCH